jgi:hypothetical protein
MDGERLVLVRWRQIRGVHVVCSHCSRHPLRLLSLEALCCKTQVKAWKIGRVQWQEHSNFDSQHVDQHATRIANGICWASLIEPGRDRTRLSGITFNITILAGVEA